VRVCKACLTRTNVLSSLNVPRSHGSQHRVVRKRSELRNAAPASPKSGASRVAGGSRKKPPGFPPVLPIAINREELAWAAGFFDGEGSTLTIDLKRQYPWIAITQGGTVDVPPAVLVRFRSAVGNVGHIEGPDIYVDQPDWLPRWVFRVAGFELVQLVLGLLWHHLGEVKRNQARGVLARWLALPHGRRAEGVRYGRALNERCARGHDYSDSYVSPRGFRTCRPCRRITQQARRERIRDTMAANQHGSRGGSGGALQ
jgi:hypothetical protein